MAKRASTEAGTEPAVPTFEVTQADSEPKWRERSPGPNPLAVAYGQAAESGNTMQIAAATADDAKTAVAFLRRAASDQGGGIKVKIEDRTADGHGITVKFKATVRKARKYTSGQVRAWAATKGITVPAKGRVGKDVTAAYREAHGIE